MSHFPPPPQLPPKVGPFRRVPPAVFPAVLGLLGLVMAWRHGVRVFELPSAPVDMVEGMVTLLFLFFVAAYGAKFVLRPGAALEDLNTLPGRTGLAAMALGFFVLATLSVARSGGASTAFLLVGAMLLLVIAGYVAFHRVNGTDQAGPPTPAMHLVFVGFVLIPAPALALGVPVTLVEILSIYCLVAALVIVGLTMKPLFTGAGTPPLRPLQGIQLAPAAFLTTACVLTGHGALATVAMVWACLVACLLLWRLRWMVEGGFSGFWSAFTFPVTAFAGALLLYGEMTGVLALRIVGGVVLVAATLYIPMIVFRVLKLWATGALAAKTNASIA